MTPACYTAGTDPQMDLHRIDRIAGARAIIAVVGAGTGSHPTPVKRKRRIVAGSMATLQHARMMLGDAMIGCCMRAGTECRLRAQLGVCVVILL